VETVSPPDSSLARLPSQVLDPPQTAKMITLARKTARATVGSACSHSLGRLQRLATNLPAATTATAMVIARQAVIASHYLGSACHPFIFK
jgi:hypothetical protein